MGFHQGFATGIGVSELFATVVLCHLLGLYLVNVFILTGTVVYAFSMGVLD